MPDHPTELESASPCDVAIVGCSGRFPGASSVDAFWRNLCAGLESITAFSDDALEAAGVDRTALADDHYVKARGILEGIDQFDADFFGMTAREAETTDPQHRMLLECAHEALESAACDPERFDGRIAVFAGARSNTYVEANLSGHPDILESVGAVQHTIQNLRDFIATFISYKLDLKGPSLDVQTACSTSLVAVHLAAQSLINHECDLALAGGASIHLPQVSGYRYETGGIASPDGHCRPFDAGANGTVPGNGVAIVALKRLDDAVRQADPIVAVVKATAVNNDGSAKVGFTAPSVQGQTAVIAEALAMAEIDPGTMRFIETHGTGTALGDPAEIEALTRAYGHPGGDCLIGSLKSNVGHLDAAAGAAGLIKTALALSHRRLPQSLHFERPNPEIDFAAGPFRVSAGRVDWPERDGPLRAGVSSFGIGGTNVHAVLESPPSGHAASTTPAGPQLLLLSARTESALDQMQRQLADHLREHPDLSAADAAYTLQVGRRRFPCRRAWIVEDRDDAITRLDGGAGSAPAVTHEPAPLVFMFPGQGAQHAAMGQALYDADPVYREQFDRCAERLKSSIEVDLRDLVMQNRPPDEVNRLLAQTRITQAALFAVEYAAARMWMAWGVTPAAMIGHSIGEYVAACLAGVFELEDALDLVAERGRLMQQMPTGAMLAVPRGETEIVPCLDGELCVVATNGHLLTVVGGPAAQIDALQARLAGEGDECRRLRTSHAFHSASMDPVVDPFVQRVGTVTFRRPSIPYVSNLTGTWIEDHQATDPEYWGRHLRKTVRFAEGLQTILTERRTLLEIGPGRSLATLARQAPDRREDTVVISTMTPSATQQNDRITALAAAGDLWTAGVELDWSALHPPERRRVRLPTYPFERRRYWIDPATESSPPASVASPQHREVDDWCSVPSWKRSISAELLPRTDAIDEPESWLVFSDGTELNTTIVDELDARGCRVTVVLSGAESGLFRENDTDDSFRYRIGPDRPEDYAALLSELRRLERFPQGIVHAWHDPSSETADPGAIGAIRYKAFYSLIHLAQAIGEQTDPGVIRFELITERVFNVLGDEAVDPARSLIIGPALVIPQEYSGATCRLYDLEGAVAPDLAKELVAEFTARPVNDVIAYRRGRRWTRTFEPIHLPEADPNAKRDGVYVITGGFEAPAIAVAERLAERGATALALIAPAPEPDTDDEVTAALRRRWEAIEQEGTRLFVTHCAFGDSAHWTRILGDVEQQLGRIDGVIHASDAIGQGLIQLKTPGMVEAVMSIKVDAAVALASALRDRSVGFLALFATNLSSTGGFGQVDFCAAGALLDGLAQKCAAMPPRVVTIDWPLWRPDDFDDRPPEASGMDAVVRQYLERYGIDAATAADLLDRILDTNLRQVVVSTHDFNDVIDHPERFTADLFMENVRRTEPRHDRPGAASDFAAPANETESAIASIWEDLFGITPIGTRDNFFDLGGHSLLAIQLVSRLRKTFQVEVLLSSVFEHPTVAGLSALITGTGFEDDDMDEVEALLAEIEGLSPDHARAQLDEQLAREDHESREG
ncbi:MAG: hypothetical protein CMJ18_14935 [Phycisphaeraceae bacterium]|nr:hypothetical protein [Phycisphaeraceae bacterium]